MFSHARIPAAFKLEGNYRSIGTDEIKSKKSPFCSVFAVMFFANKFVTFPMRSSISLLSCTSCAKERDDLQVT